MLVVLRSWEACNLWVLLVKQDWDILSSLLVENYSLGLYKKLGRIKSLACGCRHLVELFGRIYTLSSLTVVE